MPENKTKRKSATKKRSDVAIVDNVMTRIRVRHPSLGPSTRSIADYVLENPRKVVGMSVTELAEATGASDGRGRDKS